MNSEQINPVLGFKKKIALANSDFRAVSDFMLECSTTTITSFASLLLSIYKEL